MFWKALCPKRKSLKQVVYFLEPRTKFADLLDNDEDTEDSDDFDMDAETSNQSKSSFKGR